MKRTIKRNIGILASCLFAAAIAAPTIAFADCNALDQNAEWNQGLTLLQKQVESGKYKEALETAKPLFSICQDSPALLYFTGLAMRGTGDAERATVYFQKSSESLSIMAAEPGMSRLIWYTRYEAEHPESTPEALEEKDRNLKSLARQVAELNDEKHSLEISSTELSVASSYEATNYLQVMWTGIGIGIGGLALTATGLGLMLNKKSIVELNNGKLTERDAYTAGWALLGSGIGLTAAGIVTASIGGYHYSKAKDDAVLSFQVSPMGTSFRMTF